MCGFCCCHSLKKATPTPYALVPADTTFTCYARGPMYQISLRDLEITIMRNFYYDSTLVEVKVKNKNPRPIFLGRTSKYCDRNDSLVSCLIFPDPDLHEVIILEEIQRDSVRSLYFLEKNTFNNINIDFYIVNEIDVFKRSSNSNMEISQKKYNSNTLTIYNHDMPENGFILASFHDIPLSKIDHPIVCEIEYF